MNSAMKTVLLLWAACFSFKAVNSEAATEAQQIALEVTKDLLPPEKLSSMISEHLKSIRHFNPDMENINHRPRWAAGELFISGMTNSLKQQLNSGKYGPLKSVENVESTGASRVVFSRPYHPARLAEKLREEYDVQEAEANVFSGDGNDVSYHASAPTYSTYIFQKGWGDCEGRTGCIYKHFWEFSVAPSDNTLTVKLEKEYGSALENQTRI